MKKMVLFVLIISVLLSGNIAYAKNKVDTTAIKQQITEYKAKEKQDRQTFKQSIKNMSPEEKNEAIRKFHEKRMADRKEFYKKLRDLRK